MRAGYHYPPRHIKLRGALDCHAAPHNHASGCKQVLDNEWEWVYLAVHPKFAKHNVGTIKGKFKRRVPA